MIFSLKNIHFKEIIQKQNAHERLGSIKNKTQIMKTFLSAYFLHLLHYIHEF